MVVKFVDDDSDRPADNEEGACCSCGAVDTEDNELITDAEGSTFCEECYQP